MRLLTLLAAAAAAALPASTPRPDAAVLAQGAAVYAAHCASCHEHPETRAPARVAITITRSPEFIIRTLTDGTMRRQGAALSTAQKAAVATYLMGKNPSSGAAVDLHANRCPRPAHPLRPGRGSWNGWDGGGGGNLRFQPSPGLTAAQVSRLKLKWSFAYPGGASSQPTVVGGRVFAPSMSGIVVALDAATGCTYWAVDLGAPVRSVISLARLSSGGFAAIVGDLHGEVRALDADTGRDLWRRRIETHPMARLTGPVTVYGNRVFAPVSSFEEAAAPDPRYVCCTFRGSLAALDVDSGRLLWKSYTIDTAPKPLGDGRRMGPAGGAIWSAPTVDPARGLVYATTGNGYIEPAAATTNAVIAFDLASGRKRWVRQLTPNEAFVDGCLAKAGPNCPAGELGPDFDFGAPALLIGGHGRSSRLILTSKSGMVFGLDPDARGRTVWQARAGSGGLSGGAEWGGASDGATIYVSITDLGGRRSPGVQPAPGLTALAATDGRLLWRVPAPAAVCAWGVPCLAAYHAAPTAIPGVVFSGAFDGHERAYAAETGRLLWDFDTGRSFEAVNGGRATGGSIDQGGQVVADGRLFVTSGARKGYPGNALLVFSVDGK